MASFEGGTTQRVSGPAIVPIVRDEFSAALQQGDANLAELAAAREALGLIESPAAPPV